MTTQISAFAPNFQTPYTEQGEPERGARIRRKGDRLGQLSVCSRGAPAALARRQSAPPTITQYPVYNDDRLRLPGHLLSRRILRHLADHAVGRPALILRALIRVQRPIPQLGVINSFESASSSVYNGMTVSLKRQVGKACIFRSVTPVESNGRWSRRSGGGPPGKCPEFL